MPDPNAAPPPAAPPPAAPPPAPAAPGAAWLRPGALALSPLLTLAALAFVVPLVGPGQRGWAAAALLALGALGTLGAWHLSRRLDAAWQAVQAGKAQLQEFFDALPLGTVAYDDADRIVFFNRSFAQLYAPLGDVLAVGRTFDEIVRAGVERGLIPEARGREQAWLEERLWSRREAAYGSLREMADGRWRRITEHRVAGGGRIAYSVDVTELVRREQSVDQLRREAELARTRLRDAIEALPAGFELYDAEDRLVLVNSKMKEFYPRLAHVLVEGMTFEELVRANHAAGGLPARIDDFEAWLAARLAQRRHPEAPRIHALADGRYVRVHERRTSEGGLVGVRIDVTGAMLGAAADGPNAPHGLHLTADLERCTAGALLTDAAALRARCLEAVRAAGLTAVAELFHPFPAPGGVTGVVLLAESHLALHTWPEDARVTLDVFVCNRGADNRERARALLDALVPLFEPGATERHRIARGAA